MQARRNHDRPGGRHGSERQAWRREAMALLARAERMELEAAWAAWPEPPAFEILRKPQIGLAMVRGRIGGGGSPFNLGEVTVTRATVRLASGEMGTANVLGRDRQKTLLAAVFDALWQSSARPEIERIVLSPIRARLATAVERKRRETAATRVSFFTLVRGED